MLDRFTVKIVTILLLSCACKDPKPIRLLRKNLSKDSNAAKTIHNSSILIKITNSKITSKKDKNLSYKLTYKDNVIEKKLLIENFEAIISADKLRSDSFGTLIVEVFFELDRLYIGYKANVYLKQNQTNIVKLFEGNPPASIGEFNFSNWDGLSSRNSKKWQVKEIK